MLLEVRDVKRKYLRNKVPFYAVDGLSFCMDEGEFVYIVGRSGSGKSTLLNMLAGLLRPTSGEIIFNGEDIVKLTDKKMSELRNQQIGYIPQGARVLHNLSVIDNIRLPFYLSGKRQRGEIGSDDERIASKARFLLSSVGIEYLTEAFPSELSGGELKRLLIARALINEPSLLIADEPTSDLDAKTTGEVMKLFAKINEEGTAILMVTHKEELAGAGDRTIRMEREPDRNLMDNSKHCD
jgi:putative ABC transport system ATP-binding protein